MIIFVGGRILSYMIARADRPSLNLSPSSFKSPSQRKSKAYEGKKTRSGTLAVCVGSDMENLRNRGKKKNPHSFLRIWRRGFFAQAKFCIIGQSRSPRKEEKRVEEEICPPTNYPSCLLGFFFRAPTLPPLSFFHT